MTADVSTQALSVKSPEIFFLTTRSFLFQDPRLSQADLQPLQKVNILRSIYVFPPFISPRTVSKERSHVEKSSFLADLILPAYIHRDQAFCLETYRISPKIQLAQKANSKAKKGNSQCCRCSRAALNEFPKIVNPGIKALMATSLQDLQRDQRVMTKWL